MDQPATPFPSAEQCMQLTAWEYSRLQMLNSELTKAERWIVQRSEDMVLSYSLAAAQERHADDGGLDEDVELTATLIFLAGEGQPGAPIPDHRIITQIRIPILSKLRANRSASTAHQRANDYGAQRGPWNQLLLELYNHALQCDKTRLLSIGSICIDVILVHQRLRSW